MRLPAASTSLTGRSSRRVTARLTFNGEPLPELPAPVVTSTGKDSGLGTYASAEVQFVCVQASDLRVVGSANEP